MEDSTAVNEISIIICIDKASWKVYLSPSFVFYKTQLFPCKKLKWLVYDIPMFSTCFTCLVFWTLSVIFPKGINKNYLIDKCTSAMIFATHYEFNLVIDLVARFWLELLFAAESILSHHFGGCYLPFIIASTLSHVQRIIICQQHVWSSEMLSAHFPYHTLFSFLLTQPDVGIEL